MSALTLYSYYRSSASWRVRISLHLKNLDFEYKPVHLVKDGGEQFKEDFKKINPFCQTPCLEHKGRFLSQSLPILLYLEDLKPQPSLLPKDSFKKAEILSFCEMINSGMQPLQNLSVLKYIESQSALDKNKWAAHWINKGLSACESFLKPWDGAFCFGEELSLADLFVIPQIYSARRFKVPLEGFPSLNKINENCSKIPAFQKALPENQPDAPAP